LEKPFFGSIWGEIAFFEFDHSTLEPENHDKHEAFAARAGASRITGTLP
jgi:hypothetical protein